MAKRASAGVGYKNPPRHTRFKPGQSGNPAGRPKGAKDLASVFWKVLAKRVAVQTEGGRKKISKNELLLVTMINEALKGDARARSEVLRMMGRLQDAAPSRTPPPGAPLHANDELVIADIIRRIRAGEDPTGPPQPPSAAAPDVSDPKEPNKS